MTPGPNVDFGSVAVGNFIVTTFTITNNGTAALNLTGTPAVIVTGASDFSVTQPGLVSIPAGGQTTWTATYSPTIFAQETASVTISNDDTSSTVNPTNLTGTGTP